MKKLLWLLAAFVLVVGLAACGEGIANLAGSSASVPGIEEPPPLNPAPLTGLEKTDEYVENRRITAVMVNNIDIARPTRGLTQADVLVEIVVEGGITRFMALYQDYEKIPQVGTFRSARDQFFQLILPYQALYAHVGESTMMAQYFREYEYDDYNLDGNLYQSLPWWADRPGYPNQEYRCYTSGERIAETIDKYNLDDQRQYNSTIFHFVPYNEEARTLPGESVNSFTISHSQSYRTSFDYSGATNEYDMSQFYPGKGTTLPAIDENNGNTLSFSNVLVIFARMNVYPGTESGGGVMQVHYNEGGMGYYFNGGKYEIIRWAKATPMAALEIFDGDGNQIPVQINTGKTYIAVVNDIYLESFYNQIESIVAPPASSATAQAATATGKSVFFN